MNPHLRSVLFAAAVVAAAAAPATAQPKSEPPRLVAHTGQRGMTSVAFSPDGKRILIGSEDKTARLWDAETGQELFLFNKHSEAVAAVAFSPDGKQVLTGSNDWSARLWDAQTGKAVRTFKGHSLAVKGVAFSPDGKRVLTGSDDHSARLWETETGKEIQHYEGHISEGKLQIVRSVAFSPRGTRVLTGGDDNSARLWEAVSGKLERSFVGHAKPLTSAIFSPDGTRVLTGSQDQTAWLWDEKTAKVQHRLHGHTYTVFSVAFSRDGKFILTGGGDQTTRLWDAATGKTLCRLISFRDGTWAVVDGAGRYDAAKGGDIDGLHWVVGDEVIALKQLKERYYDPGLLAKHLGLSEEPLRNVAAFEDVKLFPTIAVVQADPKKPRLDVTLTNRGGGIGRVVVLVNGKEQNDDARPRKATDANAANLDLRLDLTKDARLTPRGNWLVPRAKNRVEVLAYNADDSLCSRGMVREFDGPDVGVPDPPQLYAVVAGVSKYKGDKLNLRYAAKDAADFAAALKLAGGRLFGANKVHVTRLTGSGEDSRPTRARLTRALEGLKGAKSGDVVVVYLAGHGVTQGGQDGEWYYLSADAQPSDLSDPAVLKRVGVSSAELTDLLKMSPAQKQVMVLDTCHSGLVVEKLTERRDVPGSQVRALERFKDRTGVYALAGCAADSVSYEASRYGQGLLTYSLLLGMKGAKLREGEFVDVADLFGFAADKVPELARNIGGVQRPIIASPRGAPFDIGQLTAADRAKIPLQQERPLVLRANFQEDQDLSDVLGLSGRINERMRGVSAAAGRGASLVYVDAADCADAFALGGRYSVSGTKVEVTVRLRRGEEKGTRFTVQGEKARLDELAAKVVTEVEKRLAEPSGK